MPIYPLYRIEVVCFCKQLPVVWNTVVTSKARKRRRFEGEKRRKASSGSNVPWCKVQIRVIDAFLEDELVLDLSNRPRNLAHLQYSQQPGECKQTERGLLFASRAVRLYALDQSPTIVIKALALKRRCEYSLISIEFVVARNEDLTVW